MGVPTTLRGISATAGANSPAGTDVIGSTADDYLRSIQAVTRQYLASVASNIVSATTTDLSTADGFWVTITGTTAITGLGTESAGIWYGLTFSGILTFTHNGTSLILPGAANITTAAGDTCFAESLGSGNWRIWSYQRASGLPFTATQSANAVLAGPTSGAAAAPTFRSLVGAESSTVLLGSKTLSGSASASFVHTSGTGDVIFDWTAFDEYEFHFVLVVATNNAITPQAQISEDSGTSYKSGAATYTALQAEAFATPSGPTATTQNTALWNLTSATLLNSTDYGLNGVFKIVRPSATVKKLASGSWTFSSGTSSLSMSTAAYQYSGDSNAWTGIKFFPSASTWASGTIYAYGIRKA